MFCNHCGKQIRDDADFCPFCGGQIASEAQRTVKVDFGQTDERQQPAFPQPFYGETAPEPKKKGKGKIVVVIVAIVLALALAGGAAWFFIFNKSGNDDNPDSGHGFMANTYSIKRGGAFYLRDDVGLWKLSEGKAEYVKKDVSGFATDGDIIYYTKPGDDGEIMCSVKTDGSDDKEIFTLTAGFPLMEKDGVLYYAEKADSEMSGSLYAYDLDSEKKDKKLDGIFNTVCFNNRIYFSEENNLCYYDVDNGGKIEISDNISGLDVFGDRLYAMQSEEESKNIIYRLDSENKLHEIYTMKRSVSEEVSPIDEDNLLICKSSDDKTEARIYNISSGKNYYLNDLTDYVTAVDYDGRLMVITRSAAYLLDTENHKLGEKVCDREFMSSGYFASGDYIYEEDPDLDYSGDTSKWTYKFTPIKLGSDAPEETAAQTDTQETDKDISTWKVEGLKNKTYTGKIIKPSIDVVSDDGEYAEFDVTFKNNKKVGTATAEITGKGKYTGTITKTFKILKAKQKLKLKASAKKLKASNLRKKKATLKKVVKVSGNKGKLTYKKASGSKKVSVSKKGVITVKKGKYKKNTLLKVKVKVTAKSTKCYKKTTKKITVKIKVK